ncbi:flagellin [Cytobacillus sp. FJAT-54145]|uniref:Flagellin n=1 Tax=Cytobacillus spartinae TaxID=3299023 RepID=A0ABW6KBX9_9BACI
MRINHNIAALNTHRQLNTAAAGQSKSMEKLASGLRINRAGDDAAGLAISEKMRGQIRGLDQASRNAQDGISLIQTAEGALNETHSILQRGRELAVQAANDTATQDDRKEIQKEINQLLEEVDRIANQTEFNTQKLLNGNSSNLTLHIGSNKDQTMNIQISTMTSADLGEAGVATATVTLNNDLDFSAAANNGTFSIGDTTIALNENYSGNVNKLVSDLNKAFQSSEGVTFSNNGNNLTMNSNTAFSWTATNGSTGTTTAVAFGVTSGAANAVTATGNTGIALDQLNTAVNTGNAGVTTQLGAETAIQAFDNAIKEVSGERSKLGAYQNRLEHTINNLGTSSENLTAAESRIRDVDMAKEMMSQTKNSILSQAAQAMLAQANQQPQGVLQLLR